MTWFPAEHLALAGLLVFTILVRGSVLWAMRGNLKQDPDAYREIAEFMLQRGEFALGKLPGFQGGSRPIPTAYRPPLYPIVLSNLPAADRKQISLFRVAILHVWLGVVTVWLTWVLARQMVGGTIAPLAAGLIVACDPILLNQQSLIMTETLAAFVAVLSLWCLARFDQARSSFNAFLGGGAIALAVLCRPTFLAWLALIGATMLLVRGKNSERSPLTVNQKSKRLSWDDFGWRAGNLAGLLVGAAAILSPWVIRNYRVFGKPIVTTTHGGYTLLLGNNDEFYRWLNNDNSGLPWDSRTFDALLRSRWSTTSPLYPHPDLGFDRLCYQTAIRAIRAQPAMFLRACAYRIGQLWSPLPHKLSPNETSARRLLRYATCAWYCGVYLLAAVGIWRLRGKLVQPPWIWGLLLCFAFTAVHTFYWTNLRMRAPLMPFVALVAAAAIIRPTSTAQELLNSEPRTRNR
jgi:hypothetical protein